MRHFRQIEAESALQPCRDAALVNRFANHRDIRPYIGGKGALDLSALTHDPHVCLIGAHGGFCLAWTAPRTWEIHTLIAPKGRGAWAENFARQSLNYMIHVAEADLLWTRVHPDHRHTAIFTRRMGLKPCGEVLTDFGDGPIPYKLFEWRRECPQQ